MEACKSTKKTVKALVTVLVTVLGIGVLMFGPNLFVAGQENKNGGETGAAALFSVKTASAEKRTLRAFLDVNGEITSGQQAEAFPDMAGKLVAVHVTLGARVSKGDVIAEVDPSKPGADYMNSPVYAPISGIVSKTPLSVGATVSAGTSIAVISTAANPEISARIPEREIAGLRTGLKAEVSLQAYPGEIFSATVVRVSPVLDSASRTKLITLRFDREDGRINAGMFARLRINTRTYNDTLTVPAGAVVNRHGENMVYVLRDAAPLGVPPKGGTPLGGAPLDALASTVEARKVASGVTLDGWTEIKSGLAEGEAVVVQGQQLLSGGEAVRVVARAGK